MEIDPATLEEDEAYKLLVGVIVPRPIAWVTSIQLSGRINVAPFSCYTFVSHVPPMLAISVGRRNGELKDTSRNARDRGEFVVNVVDDSQMEPMHASSRDYPADVSEVDTLGLALAPSSRIATPRLAVAPVAMECRFDRIVEFGRLRSTLVVGEVVHFYVRDDVIVDRRVDPARLRPLGRLGGPRYAKVGDIVTLTQLHNTKQ